LISLTHYLKRPISTGFDTDSMLHGFFGYGWRADTRPLHEVERGNYLLAAKSETWLNVKNAYAAGDGVVSGRRELGR